MPKERVRLPERTHEFGTDESEHMLAAFLPRFVPGVERAERASRFDDEKVGADVIAYLENGQRLAVQWTITDSSKRRQEKVAHLLRSPFVYLHDDRGQVTFPEKIPLVILYAPKEVWGRAWNQGGGDPYEAVSSLEHPEDLGGMLMDMACDTLELVASLHPELNSKERTLARSTAGFLREKSALRHAT